MARPPILNSEARLRNLMAIAKNEVDRARSTRRTRLRDEIIARAAADGIASRSPDLPTADEIVQWATTVADLAYPEPETPR
jgi:hypothetical protein